MQDGTSLKYFAQDHLSSTSIVMNASGGLLSHNRYMPFGEVRDITGSQDPITQTDFGYTGQRNLASMGLMDYRARFYSPLLGRFTQPDTFISNPVNPQSFNRYSYVLNNPIKYNDPSGHWPSDLCLDDGYCGIPGVSYFTMVYTTVLENRYQWNLEGRWSLNELETMYNAANDIEQYVNQIADGNGLAWMNEYLGGTEITHYGDSDFWVYEYEFLSPQAGSAWPGWFPGLDQQNTIFLADDFSVGTFIHELGHIWDINTGEMGGIGVVGGVADYLNDYLGGDALSSVYCTFCTTSQDDQGVYIPSPHIPEDYPFLPGVNWGYGNSGTGEYLAEAFKYMILDPSSLPADNVRLWMEIVIALQTDLLP